MAYKAPRGTRDILPADIELWQKVERTFAEVCQRYGYAEIRLPTFECTEVYQRGVGDTTDIVQKEMYTFLDKSNRSMTLRPEGTAGVVRSFIENGMSSLPYPVKLFYNLNLFRYERVAKGRYREFHQLGVEAFGSPHPFMEVEVISLLYDFFQSLGLKNMKLHLNSIGDRSDREAYNEKLRSMTQDKLECLCGDCQQRFHKNPMRMLDCKVDKCQEVLQNAPRLLDSLTEQSLAHHQFVCQALSDLEIPYIIDKDIVRGLDYYTHTVFEFVSENVGTQGTICGGGRYDNLVEELGGQKTPACGFAIGFERLLMELEAQSLHHLPANKPDLFIASIGEQANRLAMVLAEQLRKAKISAHADICARSLKAQLKYADKLAYRYVVVLGEDEIVARRAKLKKLHQSLPEQEQVDKQGKIEADDLFLSWSGDLSPDLTPDLSPDLSHDLSSDYEVKSDGNRSKLKLTLTDDIKQILEKE